MSRVAFKGMYLSVKWFLPRMSIPVGLTASDLPVGMEIDGPLVQAPNCCLFQWSLKRCGAYWQIPKPKEASLVLVCI